MRRHWMALIRIDAKSVKFLFVSFARLLIDQMGQLRHPNIALLQALMSLSIFPTTNASRKKTKSSHWESRCIMLPWIAPDYVFHVCCIHYSHTYCAGWSLIKDCLREKINNLWTNTAALMQDCHTLHKLQLDSTSINQYRTTNRITQTSAVQWYIWELAASDVAIIFDISL